MSNLCEYVVASFYRMPRIYKRKTEKGTYSLEDINNAIQKILQNNEKIRKVANETGIDKSTLCRYVKKAKTERAITSVGYYGNRKIFYDHEEAELCKYLKSSARMYFGLTPVEVRKLAFEIAHKNNKSIPHTWLEKSMAGEEWLRSFLKRHNDLTIRTPEATSIGRAASFNEENAALFYDNLKIVRERNNFEAKDIYNVDETGCTTVQKPTKVIAETGVKQVGAITSSERGQLVTICCAVNAIGHAIPPLFIFPRVHFKEHFIRDGPPGSAGTAFPSGWMTAENFLIFLHHFVKQVVSCVFIIDLHASNKRSYIFDS
jgi:transposase